MQGPQLTLDAAYKFTLWHTLLCDARERRATPSSVAVTDTHIQSASLLLRRALPRRVLRSCCLSGACGRTATLTHRRLRFGRAEVSLYAESDDALRCLSTATACVGRPLLLALSAPCRVEPETEAAAPLVGLRCLLRHATLRSVTLRHPHCEAPRAARLVAELAAMANRRLPHLTLSLSLPLVGWRAPPRLGALFALSSLRLEGCGLREAADLAMGLHAAKGLCHLSLRGNPIAAPTVPNSTPSQVSSASFSSGGVGEGSPSAMACVALFAARHTALTRLDLGTCGLRDADVVVFAHTASPFSPRRGFRLRLDHNALTAAALWALAASDASLRAVLSALDVSGQFLGVGAADAVGRLLDQCDALRSLDISTHTPNDTHASISAGDGAWGRRLCRVVCGASGPWRRLSLSGGGLSGGDVRRLSAAPFAPDAALLLTGQRLFASSAVSSSAAWLLRVLGVLDLSGGAMADEGAGRLASALTRAAPVPLRELHLGENGIEGRGNGLAQLARALRACAAPQLEVLSLHSNRLALRPVAALLAQSAATLRRLDLSYSAIAEDEAQLAELLARLGRRQCGHGKEGTGDGDALPQLELRAVRSRREEETAARTEMNHTSGVWTEGTGWLETQSAVRLVTRDYA